MKPIPVSTCAVEVFPPDWHFPAGPSWIAGWIKPAAPHTITDVRARLHHRVILGLSGLPHPAFAPEPGKPSSSQGAGFSFLFSPQRGATLLRLEARDTTGRWVEFFRTAVTAAPDGVAPSPPPSLNAALSRLITALIKHRLRAPERSWNALADESLAAFVAEPLNAHPPPPFRGALEEPGPTGRLRYGRIPVTGWLAHPSAAITSLVAIIDPLPPAYLTLDLARGDLATVLNSSEGQGAVTFAGDLSLPPDLAAPVLLKLFVELADGIRHLVFAQRFSPERHGDTGAMPPLVKRLTYARAGWALFRAAGRLSLPRRGLLRAAWAAYESAPAYRPTHNRPRQTHSPFPAEDHTLPREPSCTLIVPTDEMCMVDAEQYSRVGRDALRLVQQAATLTGNGPIRAILDLPSGHGRVARWFRTAYPAAQLTTCDTLAPGVAFCVEHLGAIGVVAEVNGGHWAALPGPYDVIWCGSLLTHFDRDQWKEHLRQFAARLSPQGVLIFTSHGLPALELLQSGVKDYGLPTAGVTHLQRTAVTHGFAYAAYPDTPAYGISIAQPGWVEDFIAQETDLRLLDYHPAAWDEHQDVVVCPTAREAAARAAR